MNILLITAHFPPEISGGISRPYSMYKYLPESGINVFVVTSNAHGQLPGEKDVFRYDSFINWRQSRSFKKKISRYISFIGYRLFHILVDTWWYRSAVRDIQQVIETNDIKLLYATFPSPEALKIGIHASKISGVPLVTEFRDGLVFESVYTNKNILQKRYMKKLEADAVASSAAVITIGNRLSAYFRNTYSTPVYTVFNGYDKHDFENVFDKPEPGPDPAILKIAHFGGLSSSRAGERKGLFDALKNLKADGTINASNFKLSFIGKMTSDEIHMLKSADLLDVVELLPVMPKKEGFKMLYQQFDYLLFYGLEGHSTIISAKLLEYINLRKPILGICEGCEAADIIRMTGTGEVCGFSAESIKQLFSRAVRRDIQFSPDIQMIQRFDRQKQAGEMAGILNNII